MRTGRIAGLALTAVAVVAGAVASGASVSPSAKISGPIVTGGDVAAGTLEVSPNSSRVIFQADKEIDERLEVYSWATGGLAQPVKLSMANPTGQHVVRAEITPDSSRALYIADHGTPGRMELWSRPADGSGSAPVVLSGALAPSGDVLEFAISPDSKWVVYVADQGRNVPSQLIARVIDGSQPDVVLADRFDAENDLAESFAISPDSSRVVYRADLNASNSFDLFSRAINGSTPPVKLSGDSLPTVTVDVPIRISADSRWVVYRTDPDTQGVFELYSRPIDGTGSPKKLNGPLSTGADVYTFEIDAGSSRVLYLTDEVADTADTQLYTRPIGGTGTPTRVNGPLVSGGRVHTFQIVPGTGLVLYRASQNIRGVWELYTRAVDGTGPNLKIHTDLPDTREIWENYMVSPDAQWVVYPEGTRMADSLLDLYAARLDTTGEPVKLNSGTIVGGGVKEQMIAISADSRRVVYGADQDTVGVVELYSRSIDGGGGSSTKMNSTLTANGDVTDYAILPDSSGVVYRADQEADERFEAFAARWVFPDAVDDLATVAINGSVEVHVMSNDRIAAGALDPSSVAVTVGGVSGSAQVTGSGTVTYTATREFEGYDSFAYTVCAVDDPSLCDTAVVYVGVGNVPPPTTPTTAPPTTTTAPPTTTTAPPTTTTAPPTTTTAPPTTTTAPPTTTTAPPTTTTAPPTTTTHHDNRPPPPRNRPPPRSRRPPPPNARPGTGCSRPTVTCVPSVPPRNWRR